MPEENVLASVSTEVEERLDHAANAAKATSNAVISVPSEVADIANDFLGGATDVASDTAENVIDAVNNKIKQGLAVLRELGGVLTGD